MIDQKFTEVPKVKTKVVHRRDGRWDLYIVCPFCGKKHHHGGGHGDKPILGNRTSHCCNVTLTYLLQYELIEEVSNGTVNG